MLPCSSAIPYECSSNGVLAEELDARRAEERAKEELDRLDRLARLIEDEADHMTKAIDLLLCLYERDPEEPDKWDSTWDPTREWVIQLSLRALDPEQDELRSLLLKKFSLEASKPIELRNIVLAMQPEHRAEVIDAVMALDAVMDAEEGRRWKQRRSGINQIIDQYTKTRVHPKLQDSAIHVFQTKIRDICERTGFTTFYENVLAPLIERLAKLFVSADQEDDQKDKDKELSKGGSPRNNTGPSPR